YRFKHWSKLAAVTVFGAIILMGTVPRVMAQNPKVEEKVMALKQSITANKQALAQYTWQEVETISIKGEVKDTKTYQVQIGANGQPAKTEVSNDPAAHGREGRLKKRVVTHVTDEYQ